MGIDIDKIRQRLDNLKKNTKKSTSLWRPDKNETLIRIVPYKFSKENPFVELYFHYSLGKPLLSPISFGRPDPIVEAAEKLKQTGDRDNWRLAKKLEPKLRTFAPIVIRGKESEGTKFWGFGKTVYQELLGYIADPDYGDITDVMNGHDITVTQHQEPGKNFPSTLIRLKPKSTPLTTDKDVLNIVFDTQKDIREIYEEKTYDELLDIFTKWTEGKSDDDDEDDSDDVPSDGDSDDTADSSEIVSDKDEKPAEKKKENKSQEMDDIANMFEKAFNK